MTEMTNSYEMLVGKPEGRRGVEYLDVDEDVLGVEVKRHAFLTSAPD
jgi:hypothetical protein